MARPKRPEGRRERPELITWNERSALLAASLEPLPPSTRRKVQAAWRWMPWIMAYTGGRAGEVVRLRDDDFRFSDAGGIPFVKLGGDERSRYRWRPVPLHPALLEAGLEEFVSGRGKGPIFLENEDLSDARSVLGSFNRALSKRAGKASEDRSISNAFRRRFKYDLRAHSGDYDSINMIEGSPRDFDKFGVSVEIVVEYAYKAIKALPLLDLPYPDNPS